MGSPLTAAIVTGAFGAALTQVQTDAMEFIVQDLPIGLMVMDTILVVTIDVKAFRRFAK